jgi:hypothetical protein
MLRRTAPEFLLQFPSLTDHVPHVLYTAWRESLLRTPVAAVFPRPRAFRAGSDVE